MATPETSAFGGTNFKPTGLAANKKLKPYGINQDADNLAYDPKARETRFQPEVFEGQKEEFEGWIITIIDHFDNNRDCYRDERARMTVVFNRARGLARQLIKSRYMSEENPFSSAQEMLAQLEAVFGNHDSSITACRTLASLMFDIKQDDINAFIARVSALADEADIRISQRKSLLYTKLPPGFDYTGHLRLATRNDGVSFESFIRSLTAAVVSRKEGFAYRQKNSAPKRKRKRESPSPPRQRRKRSERCEARKEDSTVMCSVPQIAQIGRSEPSKEFTVPVEVKIDGIGLKTKALCDTGAGIYLSMTPEFAQRVVRSLKGKIMKLPKPLQLADFSGTPRGVVTDYIRASLTIDNRQFNRQKFLIMRSNHDVFVGQNFWVQHRVGLVPFDKSFLWPDDIPPLTHGAKPFPLSDDPPRPVSIKDQADVIRRDRLREKEDKKIKRMVILKRNWREPVNVSAIDQASNSPQPSMKVPESPTGDETVVTPVDAAHSRQPRWVGIPMPIKPVPLVELPEGVVIITDCSAAPVSTAKREQDWPKMFDDKPIPFPEGETPEDIGLVRQGDIEKDAPFVKGPEQLESFNKMKQLAADDMPSAPHPDDERKPGPQEAQITSQMRGHLFRFKKKANS